MNFLATTRIDAITVYVSGQHPWTGSGKMAATRQKKARRTGCMGPAARNISRSRFSKGIEDARFTTLPSVKARAMARPGSAHGDAGRW